MARFGVPHNRATKLEHGCSECHPASSLHERKKPRWIWHKRCGFSGKERFSILDTFASKLSEMSFCVSRCRFLHLQAVPQSVDLSSHNISELEEQLHFTKEHMTQLRWTSKSSRSSTMHHFAGCFFWGTAKATSRKTLKSFWNVANMQQRNPDFCATFVFDFRCSRKCIRLRSSCTLEYQRQIQALIHQYDSTLKYLIPGPGFLCVCKNCSFPSRFVFLRPWSFLWAWRASRRVWQKHTHTCLHKVLSWLRSLWDSKKLLVFNITGSDNGKDVYVMKNSRWRFSDFQIWLCQTEPDVVRNGRCPNHAVWR